MSKEKREKPELDAETVEDLEAADADEALLGGAAPSLRKATC